MRTIPGVNQDLVVGVSFSFYFLGAVSSWRLGFTEGRHKKHMVPFIKSLMDAPKGIQAGVVRGAVRGGGLPVRHGRGDISVIEAGVPGK